MIGAGGMTPARSADYPPPEPDPVLVVVDVRTEPGRPETVVVRQGLAVQNGRLVLVGPQREERMETVKRVTAEPRTPAPTNPLRPRRHRPSRRGAGRRRGAPACELTGGG